MDHHFLPHHTSHTTQISHPSSQHGQLSQHQQPLSRPPFTESNPSAQQQPQQAHGQGSQAQAQQGQGQQPPQIRSRITVVCAECKRLKLRCDRRAPCGSCTKRDTVQRCIYSPAAAEKVDLHSLNNRLIQVEAALAMITSGQFESVYPGVRELVDNVRGMGGLATGSGPVASSGQAGFLGPHVSSTQAQGGRAEGYREQTGLGPQGQSAPLESNSHPQTAGDSDIDLHPHSHQHTHQHHHHHGTAPSQTYSTSNSFKALAKDCARVIDPSSISRPQVTQEEQTKRGTIHDDGSSAQTRLIKLEPSPSDLGFDGSRSPSPIPFFAPTSQSTSTSNTTAPPSIYASSTTATPPILLPALSIYYPLPTIPPPGSTEPEGIAPPFSGLSSSGGTFSSIPTHTTSNPSQPQITSALLALLPTGEKCLRWLELAEKVINIRGVPLEFEARQSDGQPQHSTEKTAWESFEERCWPLIGAQGKPRVSEGEKKERARHRERERRRERDRDKPPGSTASSSTSPGGSRESEKDSAQRSLKEQEREKAQRARQIYFGGLATGPGGSVVTSGIPRKRAIDEYREREGLSPSPGSSGASNGPRAPSPPLFRPPARKERVASIPFHQALATPKKDEPLTFFALMCTVLAIGGITERAQTTKQARSADSSALPGSSTSSINILQATDASPSPEFLYALGRQALGVWDTQVSSSSSSFKSCEKERQKLEYILTCSVAANYVLLGLELGVRPDRDGIFDGGEEIEGEGLDFEAEQQQQRVAGCGNEEEERMHEESSRRKAGRIIYGLVSPLYLVSTSRKPPYFTLYTGFLLFSAEPERRSF
ncbi:hypothetical protein BJ165DRAFT_154876 [Panaeolus papilionaceus]|nr:hypothetical protein BJ165DRAFT_154876 [Panaeolus papilionaceus]